MGSTSAERSSRRDVRQKVRLRTHAERRLRLRRRVLLVSLVTVLMVLFVVWNRDMKSKRDARESVEDIVAAMREYYRSHGTPPRRLLDPSGDADASTLRKFLWFNPFYPEDVIRANPVGVMTSREPMDLYLQPSGRWVVLFDGKDYRIEWFNEQEFQRRAERLRLSASGFE